MANAVAFFLLISSPAAPELTAEFTKKTPVPPPLGVCANILVTAVAPGSPDLFALKVNTSFITTEPLLFAFKVRSALVELLVIECMSVKLLVSAMLIVSGSDPAVWILLEPVNCKICPELTVIAVESSPATFNVKELADVST